MCGIAGIVSLSGKPIERLAQRLERMNNLQRHRGPDQEGIWISPNGLTGLANTRLSIVGVQDNPKLPMQTEACKLTFNGEIYNQDELRREQRQQGKTFHTGTDTEVLLKGLASEGMSYLERLDGVWSLAFYDERTNELSLARDLMGEKGLYFFRSATELIFSSEVSAILAVMKEEAVWDFDGIVSSFQYRATGKERTLFSNIRKLAAGHVLIVKPGCSAIAIERAQRLQPEKWFEFFDCNPDLDEVCGQLEELLALSYQRRLPTEVDYMSTLSGGLDSALVNFFLSDRGRKNIDSLYGHSTITPPGRDGDLNEFEASCLVARKLGNNHQDFIMYGEDALELYEQDASDSFDGIFCEGVTNFRQLARRARQLGKKVLVTSDGPDELLVGYDTDLRACREDQRLQQLAPQTRMELAERALNRYWKGKKPTTLLNWAYLNSVPFAVRPNHGGTQPWIMTTLFECETVANSYKAFGGIHADYQSVSQRLDLTQRMSLAYANTSLPDYMNTRSDRGTMRESVEVRMPFQAKYLVEFFIAMPSKWRLQNGNWSKFILRKLVDRYFGPEIAYRGKYGFAQPIWRLPQMANLLKMQETVRDSPIFNKFPFRAEARDFIIQPGHERLCWMAYTLAKTFERHHEITCSSFSKGHF